MNNSVYKEDIDEILSHRYDNGYDFFTTKDMKLLKGSPFTTLDSAMYLLELGVSADDDFLKNISNLIFSTWREDGRFKTSPTGGIYPCQTAFAFNCLCRLGYSKDDRMQKTLKYFIDTQENDGGWKCKKYSYGRGEETNYSTPITTLLVLDALRFLDFENKESITTPAVKFLLHHWEIKIPISPCHYGIGTLFNKIEYPFRGYNLFYYVYVLSFYKYAREDSRFLEAFNTLKSKTVNGQILVERNVPKLSKLNFCKKGDVSELATKRYNEIKKNLM
ncbi:hypothetical protein LJC13_03355 [Peptostreptococcaceae bacterium OttesenSCG-928-C18]|nr:hypothetical protein [Peptostreptococcaceae bacterium OttesenSCG-928-C18]